MHAAGSRITTCATVVVAAMLVGPRPVAAQPSQFYMSATSPSGAPVFDLTAGEVFVQQGGVPCDVSDLYPEVDGMTVALLVDLSGNVSDLNPLRSGLLAFLEALPSQHQVGLYTDAGQTREREAFTADRARLISRVEGLFTERGSGSQIVQGIMETWERRFDEDTAWPVIVVVAHEGSEISPLRDDEFNEFVHDLVGRGATVHAVIVSARDGGVQTNVSLNLTGNTGGVYLPIATGLGLPDALADLAERMAAHYAEAGHRYRVVFTCGDFDPAAQINARVTRPGVRIGLFADRRISQ